MATCKPLNSIYGVADNVCCFMFDLNNLKVINDTLGHKAGDTLIVSFASILRRSAPPHMFVGRIGGDEFIGIVENTSRGEIVEFIDDLKRESDGLNKNETDNSISISFSCGYAFSADYPNYTINTLMDIADKYMYKNKLEIKKKNRTNKEILDEAY